VYLLHMESMDLVKVQRAQGAMLPRRFDAHLRSSGLLPEGAAITIALSGGLDSAVLLDLLAALHERWNWALSAAHFDHRMRADSESDADQVKALCERMGVPCRVGRSPVAPRSEAEARDLRYAFLSRARDQWGGGWLVTAHQADDQAETVLFRLIRGSGLAGLAGIPAHRPPGVVRPLLPFWRAEIEDYARARGLTYLSDPTNLDLSFARNRIRHELIPSIEAKDIPDFRRQLLRLADLAGRAARVIERTSEIAVRELILEATEARIVVARKGFLAYDTTARAHLLRLLAARVSSPPGRVGTRVALEFINTCASGRGIDLAGGMVIRREFDRFVIERRPSGEMPADEDLLLSDSRGDGDVKIAGTSWRVRWALGALEGDTGCGEEVACFDPSELRFPLTVRSWRPGDRIRLPAGTRKLKKVFVDRKVGRSERLNRPLLTDGNGVLWVVGLVRGIQVADRGRADVFSVGIRRER